MMEPTGLEFKPTFALQPQVVVIERKELYAKIYLVSAVLSAGWKLTTDDYHNFLEALLLNEHCLPEITGLADTVLSGEASFQMVMDLLEAARIHAPDDADEFTELDGF